MPEPHTAPAPSETLPPAVVALPADAWRAHARAHRARIRAEERRGGKE
nr:hypothetical protein [Micrococcus sp. HSID17228]